MSSSGCAGGAGGKGESVSAAETVEAVAGAAAHEGAVRRRRMLLLLVVAAAAAVPLARCLRWCAGARTKPSKLRPAPAACLMEDGSIVAVAVAVAVAPDRPSSTESRAKARGCLCACGEEERSMRITDQNARPKTFLMRSIGMPPPPREALTIRVPITYNPQSHPS